MMGLKTLKDCGTDTRFCSKLPMFARSELRTELKQEAIKWIKAIQSGSGVNRNNFPDSMKGSYPKRKWDDSTFTIGLEYGFIIGLMEFLNITEEEVKC